MESLTVKKRAQNPHALQKWNGFHLQKFAEVWVYCTNILCQADTVNTLERMIA